MKRTCLKIIGAIALAVFTSSWPILGQPVYTYTVTDLGNLGGNFSIAQAINTNGQVAGYSYNSNGARHAFLWNGSMQDLGTLPGSSQSAAYGINAQGQVVGTSDNIAFLYSNGHMTNLNNLIVSNPGWTLQQATAINSQSQIVGWGINPSGEQHAFMFSNGVVLDLGSFGDISQAWGINDNGQVTGFSFLDLADTVMHSCTTMGRCRILVPWAAKVVMLKVLMRVGRLWDYLILPQISVLFTLSCIQVA